MLTAADYEQLLADYPPLDASPCEQSKGVCDRHFIRATHYAGLLGLVGELVGADPEDDEAVLPNVERVVRERDQLRERLDEHAGGRVL